MRDSSLHVRLDREIRRIVILQPGERSPTKLGVTKCLVTALRYLRSTEKTRSIWLGRHLFEPT